MITRSPIFTRVTSGAGLEDGARALVAEDHRELHAGDPARRDRHVGVAHAAGVDAHPGVAEAERRGG